MNNELNSATQPQAAIASDLITLLTKLHARWGDCLWIDAGELMALEKAADHFSAPLSPQPVAESEPVAWSYEVRQRGNNAHLWNHFYSPGKHPPTGEGIRNLRPLVYGDVAPAAALQPVAHDLYTDADKNRPEVICDRNGQVVLGLCKKCGKGECELVEACVIPEGGAA